jgi:hypothetical protein
VLEIEKLNLFQRGGADALIGLSPGRAAIVGFEKQAVHGCVDGVEIAGNEQGGAIRFDSGKLQKDGARLIFAARQPECVFIGGRTNFFQSSGILGLEKRQKKERG